MTVRKTCKARSRAGPEFRPESTRRNRYTGNGMVVLVKERKVRERRVRATGNDCKQCKSPKLSSFQWC
jgi:hypothetical protein